MAEPKQLPYGLTVLFTGKISSPTSTWARFATRSAGVLSIVFAASTTGGCAPSPQLPVSPNRTTSNESHVEGAALAPPPPAPHPGALIAEISPGSFGPHLARAGSHWLALWETPEGPEAGWYSAAFDGKTTVGSPTLIAPATPHLVRLEVASLSQGRVAVLGLQHDLDVYELKLMLVDAEGRLIADPRVAAQTSGQILWMQVVPTPNGGLCVWAESDGSTAQLFGVPFSDTLVGKPTRIAEGARAWQLAEHDGTIALSTLEGAGPAQVQLRLLDQDGRTRKSLTLSQGNVLGGLDLDLTITSGRIVAAWSQKDGLESRIVGALLNENAELKKRAAPLTVPRGHQVLERIVADPEADTIALLWQEKRSHPGEVQELALGFLQGDELVNAQATLSLERQDALLPQFALQETTLFGLLQMSWCPGPQSCDNPQTLRTAWSGTLDGSAPALDLRAMAPELGGPSMLWDLRCDSGACAALAADNESPTHVYALSLKPGAREGSPLPSPIVSDSTPPYVATRQALAEVPELSSLDGATLDGKPSLLAWLSYFDPNLPYVTPARPAPDGRRAPVRARLETLVAKAESGKAPLGHVISYRARSLGKVSLVAPQPTGLLAWAAMDGTQPQLFATIINSSGARLQQKMLTRTPGEVGDVTAVATPGGFLIAWVDGRDESQEVWALVVDHQLRTSGPVQVSEGARAPTGVTLHATKEGVIALWSDARGTSDAGAADLFVTRLDSKTAKPLEPEHRLVSTLAHCHSPQIASHPADPELMVVAWIEARPVSQQMSEWAAQSSGRFTWAAWDGRSRKIEAQPHENLDGVGSFSLHCRETNCGALLSAHDGRGGTDLWLATGTPSKNSQLTHLESLRAHSPLSVTPLLLGSEAFFVDRSHDAQTWLLTQLELVW